MIKNTVFDDTKNYVNFSQSVCIIFNKYKSHSNNLIENYTTLDGRRNRINHKLERNSNRKEVEININWKEINLYTNTFKEYKILIIII